MPLQRCKGANPLRGDCTLHPDPRASLPVPTTAMQARSRRGSQYHQLASSVAMHRSLKPSPDSCPGAAFWVLVEACETAPSWVPYTLPGPMGMKMGTRKAAEGTTPSAADIDAALRRQRTRREVEPVEPIPGVTVTESRLADRPGITLRSIHIGPDAGPNVADELDRRRSAPRSRAFYTHDRHPLEDMTPEEHLERIQAQNASRPPRPHGVRRPPLAVTVEVHHILPVAVQVGPSTTRQTPRRRGAGRPRARRTASRTAGGGSDSADSSGDEPAPGEPADHVAPCIDPRRCDHRMRFAAGPWTCAACHPKVAR